MFKWQAPACSGGKGHWGQSQETMTDKFSLSFISALATVKPPG